MLIWLYFFTILEERHSLLGRNGSASNDSVNVCDIEESENEDTEVGNPNTKWTSGDGVQHTSVWHLTNIFKVAFPCNFHFTVIKHSEIRLNNISYVLPISFLKTLITLNYFLKFLFSRYENDLKFDKRFASTLIIARNVLNTVIT